MTQEALKIALDALETELSIDWTNNDEFNASAEKMYEAIAAIKEALAQTQEPVAYLCKPDENGLYGLPTLDRGCQDCFPVYRYSQRTEQEPVAYINVEERKLEWAKPISWNTPTTVKLERIPLYTTPPQRTWVELTDEEIALIVTDCSLVTPSDFYFAKAIEAKLKEKN